MGDYLVEAGCIAAVYAVAKWAEAKFIRKSAPALRKIVKDAVVVCVCAVVDLWGASRAGVGGVDANPTKAFVGKPEF